MNKPFVTSAVSPSVKELFHAIKSNNKERDEKIKPLQKENKGQYEKIEQLQQATSSCCCVNI